MATLNGTNSNNDLEGTSGPDSIVGNGGNDKIQSKEGNDTVYGDDTAGLLSGNDDIQTAEGNDLIFGGAGSDTIQAGPGNDTIDPGSGNDNVQTGDGKDLVFVGTGADSLQGNDVGQGHTLSWEGETGNLRVDMGDGSVINASVNGAADNDVIEKFSGAIGGSGNDTIIGINSGGGANNHLGGGAGNDSIDARGGADSIEGGAGDDIIRPGTGNDTVFGGSGNDTIVFAGNKSQYTITEGTDAKGGFFQLVGPDGTDKIYEGEILRFNDGDHPICFMPGTMILTPAGEVAVEALRTGDLVTAAGGDALPVRWVGRQTVSTVFADPLAIHPIRIRAGALAEGVPARDLRVSPRHALLVDGVLAEAGALVNGTSILRDAPPAEVFTYYHVELAEHRLLIADGAPAESFVDNVDRENFDNWADRAEPASGPVAEMTLPRAKAQRQLPRAVRERLRARAEALGLAIADRDAA